MKYVLILTSTLIWSCGFHKNYNSRYNWQINPLGRFGLIDSFSYKMNPKIKDGIDINYTVSIRTYRGDTLIQMVKTVTEFLINKKDGLSITLGFPDNRVIAVEQFLDGRQTGYRYTFYSNGNLHTLDTFNGIPVFEFDPWILDSLGNVTDTGNFAFRNPFILKPTNNRISSLIFYKHLISDSIYPISNICQSCNNRKPGEPVKH